MRPRASSERRRTSASVSEGSWVSSVSLKWSSIRIKGLRRVIGSWKISPISGPRRRRRSRSPSSTMLRPPNWIVPSMTAPRGRRPMIPRPSVDLPQPDSPTSPSVSPVPISNETPSTARTGPRLVPYQTLRSSTVRTALTAEPAQFPPVDRSLETAARAEPVRPERDIASDVSYADLLDGRLRGLRRPDDVLDRAPPGHRGQGVGQAPPERGQPGHEGDDGEA